MVASCQHQRTLQQVLPLVDIGKLRYGSQCEFRAVADTIGAAARDIGFFRIWNHGIDQSLIDATYDQAAKFFALPENIKRRYYIGLSQNHRGYVPFTEKGDYPDEVHRSYEAFDLGLDLPQDDPDYLSGVPLLGPNVWPDLPRFREVVRQYYLKIASLGRLLCTALEVHLNLPIGAMTGHMTKPLSQLRLLHYVRPSTKVQTTSVNMGAHTDYECLTLLHTRNEGLQVMTLDDQWIDVPVDTQAYVVNIGDMLEAWSNGLLRSTPHRVLNLCPERFSMPYFVAADYPTVIQPFSSLGSAGRGQYEPFVAGKHLESMLARDFPYLRNRARINNSGGIYPPETHHINPFEQRLRQNAM